MRTLRSYAGYTAIILLCLLFGCKSAQQTAVDSITAEELKFHLGFIASDEFQGRNAPSQGLNIASRYIATQVESYGLRSLMPDGSFFQKIPLEVHTVDQAHTRIRLTSRRATKDFTFPQDFGISDRFYKEMKISGEVLFVGYGLSSSKLSWDDLQGLNLKGKIVVMLDPDLPGNHRLNIPENRRILRFRSHNIGGKGAAAVLTVISEEREKNLTENGFHFDSSPRCRLAEELKTVWMKPSQQRYLRAEIRHSVATEILGLSQEELKEMFATIKRGEQVPAKELQRKKIDISLKIQKGRDSTHNVVAWLEGTNEQLKQEYVLFGSHHDHIGAREGRVFNGADDNGSGTVAMLEIAQALSIARPKRSVILVWHTAEEKGLWGSRYFVEHSPVPVEKMSAELNMDMICRNDLDHLYLVGSNKLSSELDAIIQAVNDRHIRMNFDYTYEDPKHEDNFFFRSDQYPYIQYGIPAVWFFCGTTEDYHQETDTVDRADFDKMERVTRLVYLIAMEIGNWPEMLKLDLHPEITTRGEHNLKVRWR
ncbi:MAG: M28 family peptidase [Candidatus Aminicenantes bacterium]|nr:M28 family peptidase [Candidatus Aminicenantes bacterium]